MPGDRLRDKVYFPFAYLLVEEGFVVFQIYRVLPLTFLRFPRPILYAVLRSKATLMIKLDQYLNINLQTKSIQLEMLYKQQCVQENFHSLSI